jgi:hypothetical protein
MKNNKTTNSKILTNYVPPLSIDGWWAVLSATEKLFAYGLAHLIEEASSDQTIGIRKENGVVFVGYLDCGNKQPTMEKLLSFKKPVTAEEKMSSAQLDEWFKSLSGCEQELAHGLHKVLFGAACTPALN